MKKLIVLVLSVGLLFSVAGCKSSKVDDKALTALEKSIQKMQDIDSANYVFGFDLEDDGGEPVNMSLSGSFISSPKLRMTMSLDMSSQEEELKDFMQLFINEENIYFNMMDLTKSKLTLGDLSKSLLETEEKSEKFTLEKDDLKKYLKEASIKGDTLKLVLDEKKVNEEYKKQNGDSKSVISQELNVKEFSMTITLKKEFMEKAVLHIDATQTVDKKESAVKGDVKIEFKEINAVKDITFPDFSDYVDSGTVEDFAAQLIGMSAGV